MKVKESERNLFLSDNKQPMDERDQAQGATLCVDSHYINVFD